MGAGITQESRAETARRADFAVEWLQSILKAKIGKAFAYTSLIGLDPQVQPAAGPTRSRAALGEAGTSRVEKQSP